MAAVPCFINFNILRERKVIEHSRLNNRVVIGKEKDGAALEKLLG